MHDLLIRGGQVVDGTGAAARRADVAITDGRIAEVGVVDGAARRTIEADGQVVSPGFIDVHTHLDVQGFFDPTLSPSSLHGVTTVLGGNCGFSVAPLDDTSGDYLMRMLSRVEAMPLTSLQTGVPWDWRSTAEFLDRLDGTLAVNAGFMVGHSAIRRVVMGPAAVERAATEDEIPHDKDPEHSRCENDPLQPIQHRELLTTRFDHSLGCRWCSVRFEDRTPQRQRSRMRLRESKRIHLTLRATACWTRPTTLLVTTSRDTNIPKSMTLPPSPSASASPLAIPLDFYRHYNIYDIVY